MPKIPRTKKHVQTVLMSGRGGLHLTKSLSEKQNSPEQEILKKLRKYYNSNRNTENAAQIKKYMRGQFEYVGLKAPERRALDKMAVEGSAVPTVENLRNFLHLLWQESEREYQMFGLDYGAKHIKILIGSDVQTCSESLDCVKTLIKTKSWWDTVDMLASKLVGGLVAAYPADLVAVMDDWIQDGDMWVRRSAILHQLNYNKKTDKERLFRYCLLCADETEFFIQKAIGWALRNYFRYNAKAVKEFVNANKDRLAKLSVREALKHA